MAAGAGINQRSTAWRRVRNGDLHDQFVWRRPMVTGGDDVTLTWAVLFVTPLTVATAAIALQPAAYVMVFNLQ